MWGALKADFSEFVSTVTEDIAAIDEQLEGKNYDDNESNDKNDSDNNDDTITKNIDESDRSAPWVDPDTGIVIPDDTIQEATKNNSNTSIHLEMMEETYTIPLDETDPDVQAFLKDFDIGQKTDQISALLKDNPDTLQEMFTKLNSEVSYEEFWKRYFYKCDQARIEKQWELHQERIVKEQQEKRARAISGSLSTVKSFFGGAVKAVSKTLDAADQGSDADDNDAVIAPSPFGGAAGAASAATTTTKQRQSSSSIGGFFGSSGGRPPFVLNTAVDEDDDDDDDDDYDQNRNNNNNENEDEEEEEELGWSDDDDDDDDEEDGDGNKGITSNTIRGRGNNNNDDEEEEEEEDFAANINDPNRSGEIEFRDAEKEQLQEALQQAIEERDLLQRTVEMQNAEIKNFREQTPEIAHQTQIDELNMQLFDKDAELAALKARLADDNNDDDDDNNDDNNKIKNDSPDTDAISAKLQQVTTELAQRDAKLDMLQQELEKQSKELEFVKGLASEKQDALDQILAEKSTLQSALESMQDEMTKLQSENATLQQTLITAKDGAVQNVATAQQIANDAQAQVDSLTTELQVLRLELEESKQSMAAVSNELESVKQILVEKEAALVAATNVAAAGATATAAPAATKAIPSSPSSSSTGVKVDEGPTAPVATKIAMDDDDDDGWGDDW